MNSKLFAIAMSLTSLMFVGMNQKAQAVEASPQKKFMSSCLELRAGENYYPLYYVNSPTISPNGERDSYPLVPEVPELKDIRIGIDGTAMNVLWEAKNNHTSKDAWPIVIHGPAKLCGQIDLHYNLQSNTPSMNRLELGPNIEIDSTHFWSKDGGYVRIETIDRGDTYIQNLKIQSSCSFETSPIGPSHACITIKSSIRMPSDPSDILFIEHDAKSERNKCVIEYKDLSSLTGRMKCSVAENAARDIDEVRQSQEPRRVVTLPPLQPNNNDQNRVVILPPAQPTTTYNYQGSEERRIVILPAQNNQQTQCQQSSQPCPQRCSRPQQDCRPQRQPRVDQNRVYNNPNEVYQ